MPISLEYQDNASDPFDRLREHASIIRATRITLGIATLLPLGYLVPLHMRAIHFILSQGFIPFLEDFGWVLFLVTFLWLFTWFAVSRVSIRRLKLPWLIIPLAVLGLFGVVSFFTLYAEVRRIAVFGIGFRMPTSDWIFFITASLQLLVTGASYVYTFALLRAIRR